MNTIRKIFQKFGDESADIIRKNMTRAGQMASGQTARSLLTEATDTRMKFSGPSYIWVLETGRGPRKSTQNANLESKILAWMKAKGVAPKRGQTLEQAARGITWYINKFGTKLFRDGGRKDIITPIFEQRRFDKLANDVANVEFKKTIKVIDNAIA